MPCRRMHCEICSSWACACADGGREPGPPPGNRCLQEVWADWNAGDCGLIPESEPRIWMPWPLTFGSGKVDTPV